MNQLKQELASKLPAYLMPGNVGGYNKVAWPFWYTMNFDFGTDPTYGPSTRQTQSYRVTQEAAFLIQSVYRKAYTYDAAGELSTLQLKIVDRQSTRQFNDNPLPLQGIGQRSEPSILPTPLLVMPSALIEIEMSSWLAADQAVTGSGKHQIVMFGYRFRIEDYESVLSAVFGF